MMRTRPERGVHRSAILCCWAVEFFQLTGLPADLSARSLLARLVLGVQFDATEPLCYVVGILPVVVIHSFLARRRR